MILKFRDSERKAKHSDQIWSLLLNTYSNIGGVKGITQETLPNWDGKWKIIVKAGKVVAGIIYKPQYGKKVKAVFHNGTNSAKKELLELLYDDVYKGNNWAEVGSSLEKVLLSLGVPMIPAQEAIKIFGDDIEIEDDNYHYERMRDGEVIRAILIGELK
jgi:hypothetical protein